MRKINTQSVREVISIRNIRVRNGRLRTRSASLVYFFAFWRKFNVKRSEELLRIYPDKNGRIAHIYRDLSVAFYLGVNLDGTYKWFFEDFDVVGREIVPKSLALVQINDYGEKEVKLDVNRGVLIEKKGTKVYVERVDLQMAFSAVSLNSFVVRDWERTKRIVIRDRDVLDVLRWYDGYDVVKHGEMYFVMFREAESEVERKSLTIRLEGLKPGVYTWSFLPDEAWMIIAPQRA